MCTNASFLKFFKENNGKNYKKKKLYRTFQMTSSRGHLVEKKHRDAVKTLTQFLWTVWSLPLYHFTPLNSLAPLIHRLNKSKCEKEITTVVLQLIIQPCSQHASMLEEIQKYMKLMHNRHAHTKSKEHNCLDPCIYLAKMP